MSDQYVGILLNTAMYRGIPRRKTGQESLSNYEEAAAQLGLIPSYLRIGDMDIRTGKTAAYIYRNHQYEQVSMPIPEVIHNRAIYNDSAVERKIETLRSRGTILFNVNNRYSKVEIYKLMAADPYLRSCLPDTSKFSSSSLLTFMENHNDLILKPCRGTVGRGVMRLHHDRSGWKITFPSPSYKHKWISQKLKGQELPGYIKHQLRKVPYLIQQRIPLAEIRNCPFDLRVTVQRGLSGEWGITGMFAKKSPKGAFISNLAGGGSAYPAFALLSEVMPASAATQAIHQMEHLALSAARYLSGHLPLIADLGIDIGVTADGRIYFIECNGRDQRYGFKKAGMTDTWRATYREPMAFARYLLNRRLKQQGI